MPREPRRRLNVDVTPESWKMIGDIAGWLGGISITSVLHKAIHLLHKVIKEEQKGDTELISIELETGKETKLIFL